MVYSSLFPRNSIKNLVVSKIQILFKSSYYFSKFHLSASAKDSHHEVEEAIFVTSEQVLDASAKESIQHAATKVTNIASLVCIPSSRQLKKYKIFVLPGWISGNIFMPPIVAFHEIPLVLRLQVLSVAGRLYSNLYIL